VNRGDEKEGEGGQTREWLAKARTGIEGGKNGVKKKKSCIPIKKMVLPGNKPREAFNFCMRRRKKSVHTGPEGKEVPKKLVVRKKGNLSSKNTTN